MENDFPKRVVTLMVAWWQHAVMIILKIVFMVLSS